MDNFENKIEIIRQYARSNYLPIVRDETLKKLLEVVKDSKDILEIGTAIGYSGTMMLKVSNANLTTIEKDEHRVEQAKVNFENFGISSRVNLLEGDAIEVLARLQDDNKKFDFVFMDGPKGQYIKYLPFVKQMLVKGGVLFADNVKLLGLIENEELITHKNRAMVRKMQQFIKTLVNDEDFESEIFSIDDGFIIARKKNITELKQH